jgi:hypothetical protein
MAQTTLDEIAVAIGYTATRVLASRAGGGQPIYVPKRGDAQHALARALGVEAFARLCAAFGGEMLYVPQDAAEITARDRAVAQRLADGADLATVAVEFGLTVRRVRVLRCELVDRGVLRWAGDAPRSGSGPRERLVALEKMGTGEVSDEPPGGVGEALARGALAA